MHQFRNKIYSLAGGLSLSVAFAAAPARAESDAPRKDHYAAIEADLNAYLQTTAHPSYDRAIVLDPEALETAIVLGRTPQKAVSALLEEKGFKDPGASTVAALAEHLNLAALSPQGDPMFSVGPTLAADGAARLCILLPAPWPVALAGMEFPLPGLDAETTREFIDRHEAWHCKERVIDHSSFSFYLPALDDLDLKNLLDSMPGAFEVVPRIYMWEVLSDVAALGDMIRDGKPPYIIEPVAAWRAQNADDITHCSTPALRDLNARILGMGVGAFRAMRREDAENLYADVTANNGISTPRALKAFYLHAYGSMAARAVVQGAADRGDIDARRGLLMPLSPEPAPPGPGDTVNAFIGHLVRGWDAMGALRERAREAYGNDGPTARRRTYVAMQADLRKDIEKYPESPYHAALSIRLRTEFMGSVLGIRLFKATPQPPAAPAITPVALAPP